MSHYMDGSDQGAEVSPRIPPIRSCRSTRTISGPRRGFRRTNTCSTRRTGTRRLFWLQSSRYRSEQFQPIGPDATEGDLVGPQHLRRRADGGAQGVLLFERFDWSVKSRPGAAARSRARRNGITPQLGHRLAFVDGSVSKLRMADVARPGRERRPSDHRNLPPQRVFRSGGGLFVPLAPRPADQSCHARPVRNRQHALRGHNCLAAIPLRPPATAFAAWTFRNADR